MTLTVVEFLMLSWLVAALLMVRAWFFQRRYENAAIVDVVWCGTLAVMVLVAARATDGDPVRRALVAAMVACWGFRLAWHVLADRIVGKSEDARYRSLRARWGGRANLYFFLVFQAEALGLPLFLLPVLVVMENARPAFSVWEWCGVAVYILAIGGEWLADRQLTRFRHTPANRGKTCRTGLWRYSRHPNYFFESLHWCAYVVMAIGLPSWWITLIAPALMTTSLLFISGIPLAEAQALAARGEDYREYQRVTNAFIPWFPKDTNRVQ